MSSIDQRVVEMKFQNSQFQSGIRSTMTALDKLKAALRFDKGGGLGDITKGADISGLDRIGRAVDGIKDKFSVLGAVGFSAIQKITQGVMNLANNTLQRIATGGMERALKIEEAQFKLRGLKQDVDKTMESALAAVEGTAYGLDAAVDVAAQFGATGMQAGDEMTNALLGVSGMAAMTGTSFEEIGHIFTTVAGEGKLSTMRMQQFATRGVNAAAVLAEQLGVTEQEVRKMVTNGEIDFRTFADAMASAFGEHATKAAETYKGSVSLVGSAFSRLGASIHTPRLEALRRTFVAMKPVIDDVHAALMPLIKLYAEWVTEIADKRIAFMEGLDLGEGSNFAKIIENLATVVGNLRKGFQALVAPVAKAWSTVFGGGDSVMGSLAKMTGLLAKFTSGIKMGAGASSMIEKVFIGLFSAIGAIPKALGFVVTLIGNLAKGFIAVVAVLGGASISLVRLATTLGDAGLGFIKMIAGSEKAQSIFKAMKSVFDNVVGAIKEFIAVIVDVAILVEAAFVNFRSGPEWAQMGILLLAAAFERLGFSTETAYRYAYNLWKFFSNLSGSIKDFVNDLSFDPLIDGLKSVSSYFKNIKDTLKGTGKGLDLGDGLDVGKIKVAGVETDKLAASLEGLKGKASGVGKKIGPVFEKIGDVIGRVLGKIGGYLEGLTFQELLALVNTGFFIMLYNNISGLVKTFKDFGETFKDIGESASGVLDEMGGALERFGKETVADKVMKIAIALGILAAAAYVLSTIDTASLTKALIAIAVMMAQLTITLKVMSKIEFGKETKMIKIGAMLALMAVGILILAHAVRQFEGLSWEDMAKGLISVSVLLAGLALFTKFAEVEKGSIKSMASLIVLAGAILLLSVAVEKLGTMDIKTLQQGLLTIGLILVAFASMTIIMNQTDGVLKASVAMLVLSAALGALYLVLVLYNTLEWETLAQGLLRIAAVLVVISLALQLLPVDILSDAAALLIVAAALNVLMGVMAVAALMSWESIAKGLVAIGGALLILAVGLNIMNGTIAGSAALVIASLALALLIPVLISLGMLPWEVLLKGLVGLAGIFVVLGLAGLVLAPVVPVIALLAAAILALGIAMALAGVAMIAFGFGFGLLAAAIVSGGAAMLVFFQQLVMMIPLFAQQIGLGVIAFATVIRDAGPALVAAITTVLLSIIRAGRNVLPEFLALVRDIVVGMTNTVVSLTPFLANAGLTMMLDLLTIVADNIGPIVDEATRLMVEFMDGIERNIPDLVDSGERMVRTFIREVAAKLIAGVPDMIAAAKDMAGGIISGMTSGISNGLDTIKDAAVGVARDALNAAKRWLGIRSPSRKFRDEVGRPSSEGMAVGMLDYGNKVVSAAETVGEEAIFAMKKNIGKIPELFEDDMDFNPVITPVLDLTQVARDAKGLDPMLAGANISATTSRRQADSARVSISSAANQRHETTGPDAPPVLNYTQNNYSPKALSPSEVYRNTKNQLSTVRGIFDDVTKR